MKRALIIFCCLSALAQAGHSMDEMLDRLDESLTFTAFDDEVRARFSGTIDMEFYDFRQPAPGLLETKSNNLFNARLTLFFDAQLGRHLYFFAQSRVDRGFDPADQHARMRLDEYALRYSPWDDGRLNLQIGKFGTVFGTYVGRHLSWDNPFITAPLTYENPVPVYDHGAPASKQSFLAGKVDENFEYNPVIWGPSYTTGASVAGRIGKIDFAAEIKNASLSSRPEVWDATEGGFSHPTVTARVGYRPSPAWNFGLSASQGPYLLPTAASTLPSGTGIGEYRERVLGQDISFAWHHWQLWAEFAEARFEVPGVGNADTFAWYLEAKYRFSPELFGALRFNQQLFGKVDDGAGGSTPWGHDARREDAAIGYRFTAHTQLKLQYSLLHENNSSRILGHLVAAQFTLRF